MINRKLKFLVLLAIVATTVSPVSGQQRKTTKKTEIPGRVWVGGSLNNNLRFGGGSFSFGLTPMVGYQFVKDFSVGAFLRADYYYERTQVGISSFVRYSSLDLGPGIFVRADILRQFFAQLEYEHGFLQRARYDQSGYPIVGSDGKVERETISQNFVYLGAGYSGGGSGVQYGISLHYNILDDAFSLRFPWDYRLTIRVPLNTGSK